MINAFQEFLSNILIVPAAGPLYSFMASNNEWMLCGKRRFIQAFNGYARPCSQIPFMNIDFRRNYFSMSESCNAVARHRPAFRCFHARFIEEFHFLCGLVYSIAFRLFGLLASAYTHVLLLFAFIIIYDCSEARGSHAGPDKLLLNQ